MPIIFSVRNVRLFVRILQVTTHDESMTEPPPPDIIPVRTEPPRHRLGQKPPPGQNISPITDSILSCPSNVSKTLFTNIKTKHIFSEARCHCGDTCRHTKQALYTNVAVIVAIQTACWCTLLPWQISLR